MNSRQVLLIALLGFVASCAKDGSGDGSGNGDDVYNWCFHQDSCCLMVPNVLTPNADGINDAFFVSTYNMADLCLIILDSHMNELFRTTDPYNGWNGTSVTGANYSSGMYFYDIRATSTSGVDIHRVGHLHLLRHVFSDCIHNGCPVITGDMFDPRRCGEQYPTQEIIQRCD